LIPAGFVEASDSSENRFALIDPPQRLQSAPHILALATTSAALAAIFS
jgi:hypothetical protein